MRTLVILLSALAICGCRPTPNVGDEVEIDIVEVEYEDHSYFVFDGHGVIHNPKCLNCK